MTALELAQELVDSGDLRNTVFHWLECEDDGREAVVALDELTAIAAAGLALALDIDNLRTDMLANREMLAAKGVSYEFPKWILDRLDGITASHDAAIAAALGGDA